METDYLYHYKKSRRQRSIIFFNMGVACLIYIVGLYVYERYAGTTAPENFRSIYIISFSVFSAALFYAGWWHLRNPAEFESTITSECFRIDYPGSVIWSFDVSVLDIDRVEYGQTHSHAGSGIVDHGLVLKNGDFLHISMNYGNRLNQMVAALQLANPNITFSKRVNKRFEAWPLKWNRTE